MIVLNSNSEYLKKKIFNLIDQISINHYTLDKNNYSDFIIFLKHENHHLKISSSYNDYETKITLPCSANMILEEIDKYSKKFFFKFSSMFYYPIKQEISFQEKTVNLNLIHNQILMQLCLNKNGIAKTLLYKIIWPKDKEYFINKLDTHITNLKSFIQKNFDLLIHFESNAGIMKIKSNLE